jgi:hypothetical protein
MPSPQPMEMPLEQPSPSPQPMEMPTQAPAPTQAPMPTQAPAPTPINQQRQQSLINKLLN